MRTEFTRNHQSIADKLLIEIDTALRVVAARPGATRATPGGSSDDSPTDGAAKQEVAKLMRVNHAGEIAAQALYRGQALTAHDDKLRASLLQSADEEHDHLVWCRQRAEELGGGPSKLAPFWYAGSFALGVVAGMSGDKTSLGFLAETEKQVTEHLEGHLKRLPERDGKSRAILKQMREDEIQHGQGALDKGGRQLPTPVRQAMKLAAKVMTTVAYRI